MIKIVYIPELDEIVEWHTRSDKYYTPYFCVAKAMRRFKSDETFVVLGSLL